MRKKQKRKHQHGAEQESFPQRENQEEFEDIIYEEELGEDGGTRCEDKLKKLKEELKEEKAKAHEYLTGWQTERAQFANYKTQEAKKRGELEDRLRFGIISDFLPVLDSFDMAFSNREAWENVDSAWRRGVEYIYDQFLATLEKHKLERIDQSGVAFDPNLHEPVATVPTDDPEEDHHIARIIQVGYRSGDRVIRPAKVEVYAYGAEEASEEDTHDRNHDSNRDGGSDTPYESDEE